MKSKLFHLPILFLFMFCFQLNSQPTTKYVDLELAADCNGTYSVSARTCGSGKSIAFSSLLSASNNAVAGDTILIRQGTYSGNNNRIIPANSGSKGKEIVFKNYNNEKVTITSVGNDFPVLIDKKEYIIVEGITFNNVYAWGRIMDSNHIILKNK